VPPVPLAAQTVLVTQVAVSTSHRVHGSVSPQSRLSVEQQPLGATCLQVFVATSQVSTVQVLLSGQSPSLRQQPATAV
jgi:hypothetical protein